MCILLTFLAMFTPKYKAIYKLLEYTDTIHVAHARSWITFYVILLSHDSDHECPSYYVFQVN
jgi:hypothetical protein